MTRSLASSPVTACAISPSANSAYFADSSLREVSAGPKLEANTLNGYRTETRADRRGGSGIDVLRQRRRARPASVAAPHVLARVKVMIMPWAAPCT